MKIDPRQDGRPVARALHEFDVTSGTLLERALFNHRPLVLVACLLVTALLGWQALGLRLNASFEKTIPTSHPYVLNYLAHRDDLGGLGNSVRIAVEARRGSIFEKTYLDTLARINDEVFLIPGVDRRYQKSLWTPATRWTAVTEEGLDGGTVIPEDYDGSPASLQAVRANVERSGEIGQLVAADFRSSVIFVPLLDRDPDTGKPLDYRRFSRALEQVRARYESPDIALHVTGFAKIIGDLIEGLTQVLGFFLVAVAIAGGVLYAYTRCVRSTLLVIACSLVAVLWQFGLVALLGYELDPYSVLVPFLVFAIGMSHGAQKMNGIMQDIGRGTHRLVAARYTFRRLFLAGLTALLCDAVGFAVLVIIRIRAIQELALIASVGVAVLIFTNLVLLPVLLSYLGVSASAARRSLRGESGAAAAAVLPAGAAAGASAPAAVTAPARPPRLSWALLEAFTERPTAFVTVLVAAAVALGAALVSSHLAVGDLDPGAPELRADSRYNRDSAFMVAAYAASADVLVAMVETPVDRCTDYATLAKVDTLAWQLEQLPGVEATQSMAALEKLASTGYNEGNLKWYELVPNRAALGDVQTRAPRELLNHDCSLLPVYVYLRDHKAATLSRVVESVEAFARANDTADVKFRLAAGSAGIAAATNIVVHQAMHRMLWWVYGAVIVLCYLTFRSWRAVCMAVLPLMLTSVLCEALMVALGMGVKVATLPVIALGVGIGVDYALYILSVVLSRMRAGDSLRVAYGQALRFTGKVVMLTGLTLAIGVATWAFSPIKFQADMGVLLAFMFVCNMAGALFLLPALGCFLLPAPLRAAPREINGNAGSAGPAMGAAQ